MASPWTSTFRFALTRVIPVGLVVGASMETFMNLTGFYKVAVRKASEREVEYREGLQAAAVYGQKKSGVTGLSPSTPPGAPKGSL